MKSFSQVKQQDENEKANAKREKKAFWLPVKKYWILYVFLFMTAVLSLFAGIYIGLSPDANGLLVFTSTWDTVRRVFFALYFSIGFVLVAEGAALFWESKLVFHDVDQNGATNKTQLRAAKAGLSVAVASIVLTGLSAANFIAQWTGTLSEFTEVPEAAQRWVVWSIPVLLVFNAVAAMVYWYHSAEAALSRYKNAIVLQTQAQMSEIESKAFIEEYQKVAPEMARKRGEERARELAKDDFYHRELKEGKDLDGDGHIGRPPQMKPIIANAANTEQATISKNGGSENFQKGSGK